MAGNALPNTSKEDLHYLRSGGGGGPLYLGAGVVLGAYGLIVILLLTAFILAAKDASSPFLAENTRALNTSHEEWAVQLSDDIHTYTQWLSRHGTASEVRVFEQLAELLAGSALSVTISPDESLVSAVFISAHTGATRLVFLAVASCRLWLLCLVIALYLGFTSNRPYVGADLLGQTGNGRIFYSGARAGLDRLAPNGAPDTLIRGVACPLTAARGATRASQIWAVLQQYQAVNETNEALASIIVANQDTAPFVARGDEEELLAQSFVGRSLSAHASHLLREVLSLHKRYAAGDIVSQADSAPSSTQSSGPRSSEEYARDVSVALHSVLLDPQRTLLGALSAPEIATFILSLEAGKVLAHSTEGGKWFRTSNYPHLSARAVLHSVASFPSEYDFDSRSRIRQALVNAARASAFAPVRMPQGMSEESWALRQWAEVLLASPYDLNSVMNEVELAGIVRAAHQSWIADILPRAFTIVPDLTTTSFATPADLFFVPLSSLVALLRKTLTPTALARLSVLSNSIGTKQRRVMERAQQAEEGSGSLLYDRVFPSIPQDLLIKLSSLHSLNQKELTEWSALRNILAPFGWLARRVGDYTVPETSIIFSVFKAPSGYPLANSLGLVGKIGLVPLRKSKFEGVFGREWEGRFQTFRKATMSESFEDFNDLLKGIQEEAPDAGEIVSGPAS